MKKLRTRIISLWTKIWFPKDSGDPLLFELETLKKEIQGVLKKLEICWNHFDYAQAEYIETAIMAINCCELEYRVLYYKLLLLSGKKSETPLRYDNSRSYLPWCLAE